MDAVKNLTEIDQSKFVEICDQIFSEHSDRKEFIKLFHRFDASSHDDRLIDQELSIFQQWFNILTIRSRRSALIMVDIQNDFVDGSLSIDQGPAKQNGREIIPIINRLLIDKNLKFDLYVYTLDWHPDDHISFYENLHRRRLIDTDQNRVIKIFDQVTFIDPTWTDQKLWPRHCVQNTRGSELHADLHLISDQEKSIKIYKGQNPDIDSYSAFYDNKKSSHTGLDMELKRRGISRIFVCGLAYDVCVRDTCYDALDLGYESVLLKDCCRGLDLANMDLVDKEIQRRNGLIASSDHLESLLKSDRTPLAFGKYALDKLLLG